MPVAIWWRRRCRRWQPHCQQRRCIKNFDSSFTRCSNLAADAVAVDGAAAAAAPRARARATWWCVAGVMFRFKVYNCCRCHYPKGFAMLCWPPLFKLLSAYSVVSAEIMKSPCIIRHISFPSYVLQHTYKSVIAVGPPFFLFVCRSVGLVAVGFLVKSILLHISLGDKSQTWQMMLLLICAQNAPLHYN